MFSCGLGPLARGVFLDHLEENNRKLRSRKPPWNYHG